MSEVQDNVIRTSASGVLETLSTCQGSSCLTAAVTFSHIFRLVANTDFVTLSAPFAVVNGDAMVGENVLVGVEHWDGGEWHHLVRYCFYQGCSPGQFVGNPMDATIPLVPGEKYRFSAVALGTLNVRQDGQVAEVSLDTTWTFGPTPQAGTPVPFSGASGNALLAVALLLGGAVVLRRS